MTALETQNRILAEHNKALLSEYENQKVYLQTLRDQLRRAEENAGKDVTVETMIR